MKLICFGKQKSTIYHHVISEYQKRLGKNFTLIELNHKKSTKIETIKMEEQLLSNYLKKENINIFLDGRGKEFSSIAFAQKLNELHLQNKPIVFFIGGAFGFSANFISKAYLVLSLGQMTMPHMLARLMLLEQLYRCEMIEKNHPYHK